MINKTNHERKIDECSICLENKQIKNTDCGCSTKYCNDCFETVIELSIVCSVCKRQLISQSESELRLKSMVDLSEFSNYAYHYNLMRRIHGLPVLAYKN